MVMGPVAVMGLVSVKIHTLASSVISALALMSAYFSTVIPTRNVPTVL